MKAKASSDAEVRARAGTLVTEIVKRGAVEEILAAARDGQVTKFVDLFAARRAYADDRCWKAALELAQQVSHQAAKAAGRKFKFPDVDLQNCELTEFDARLLCQPARLAFSARSRAFSDFPVVN